MMLFLPLIRLSLAVGVPWSSVLQFYCVLPSALSHSLVLFSSLCVASNDHDEQKQCRNERWRKKKKQRNSLQRFTRVNADPNHLSAMNIIIIRPFQRQLDASKWSSNNSNSRSLALLLVPISRLCRPSFNFRLKMVARIRTNGCRSARNGSSSAS